MLPPEITLKYTQTNLTFDLQLRNRGKGNGMLFTCKQPRHVQAHLSRLTGPQWVTAHLAQGSWLHCLVCEGFLPVPRQCLLPNSLDLPSGPFVQRTLLVWDPPPQVAEHDDQGSTRHLTQPHSAENWTVTFIV